jgi:hypothetical protein
MDEMSAMKTKVACPKCRASLKSARELSPGRQVTCPRCKAPFVVPGQEIAKGPPAMGVLVPGTSIRTPPAVNGPPPTLEPLELTLEPSRNRSTLILVLLGAFLVLGGGGLLIYFCFLGDKKKTDEQAEEYFQLPEPEFKPLPPRPLIPLTKAEQNQIDTAIGRGVAFLKKAQTPEGTWPGARPIEAAALAGMTLLECGVPANDPVLVKAAQYVRKNVPNMANTYGISLYILFLNRLNAPEDKARIKDLTARLVMGQGPMGGWTYQCPVLTPKDQDLLFSLLNDMGRKTGPEYAKAFPDRIKALPPTLQNLAILKEPVKGANFRQEGDNSNTQFALLALWAARGQKLPLDATLERVVLRFRNIQNPDGSWNYSGNANASPGGLPTMTCAGLLALAVGYGLPAAQNVRTDPKKDQAIEKAIQHLSKSIGGRNPRGKPRMLELYFLWSVERVGVLYHLKNIADKEWYYWGMDILLPNQNPNGSWHAGVGHGSDPIIDSCFALLFLQRANLVQDLTDKLQELLNSRAELSPAIQSHEPPLRRDS